MRQYTSSESNNKPKTRRKSVKITFIGTSHGVPAANRYCSCTLIEVGDAAYFIDAGAPMAESLIKKNIPIDNVKAVFTTHAHGDHVGYLFPFISLTNWYYSNSSIKFHVTETEFAKALADTVKVCDGTALSDRHSIITVNKDFVYDDGILKATFLPTKHMAHSGSRPSYAILIEAEGKKIMFTGDLSMHLELGDYPRYVIDNDVDAVVCELAHFGVDEVLPNILNTKTKALFFNHVYPLDKYDQLAKAAPSVPYPVFTPNDGDVYMI